MILLQLNFRMLTQQLSYKLTTVLTVIHIRTDTHKLGYWFEFTQKIEVRASHLHESHTGYCRLLTHQ